MKIGIISFAHMHAYSYAESLQALGDVDFVAIADEDSERGRRYANEFGVEYYNDYQDLLKRPDIDGVIICSENVKHKEQVIASAQAGKHILCEKPIATSVADAWEMIRACEEHNVKLQVAFPVRFSQPMMRMKQILEQERLGRIVAMEGTNRGSNPGGWFVDPKLSGGGAVLDHTVHIIDIMRWFMNSDVREVYAEVDRRFSSIPTDDCGLLMLEFENGVFASHDPSWSRSRSFPTWGDVTLKVVGTKGMAEVDALAQHIESFRNETNKNTHHFWGDGYDLGLVRNFVDCIRLDRQPFITGLDGLRAMEVAFAAYESAKTAKPVKLVH